MLSINAFPTREALMAAAAERIAECIENGLKTRGTACAALSGGATPAPAYRALAAKRGWDWNKITFALVDERFVPPQDEASNERFVRETLSPAFALGAHFKPMFFAMPTAAEAATCANVLYENLHFDIALMGMGEDGHTASWFAGASGLNAALDPKTVAPIVAVHAPQAAGAADRLTLTRGALAGADRVLLLIMGAQKRARLEASLNEPIERGPVAALFDGNGPVPEVLWSA